MSGDALLRLAGVSVRLAGQLVLDRVDLAVAPGRVVILIGPNGAGKTTLLRVALGLLAAEAGTVSCRPGATIAYMPQHIAIEDTLPLTVDRFLMLAGRASRERRAVVLGEVGAAHLRAHPVQAVSGGEMQRVLLARALLRDPDLLVLDEPAQNVDVTGQSEIYDLINRIRGQRGCGVLMVSHDLNLVMAAADTVVCLNHHVCCTGRPEDIGANAEFQALFPGRAGLALAPYAHDHDHTHAPSGEVVAPMGRPKTELETLDRA
ncbi:MAG: metal ABC transporter ATP-binding protein [Alphaproteobacteria bacterium]